MVWFLRHWNRVSDSLLDKADPNSDDLADGASTSASTSTGFSSSSPPPSMRVLLERADSFELLAPEEQEDELVDFRVSLADSADTDEYHGYHYPLLSQSQRRNLAAWARRKGSTGPDHPSHDHLHSSQPTRCVITSNPVSPSPCYLTQGCPSSSVISNHPCRALDSQSPRCFPPQANCKQDMFMVLLTLTVSTAMPCPAFDIHAPPLLTHSHPLI